MKVLVAVLVAITGLGMICEKDKTEQRISR